MNVAAILQQRLVAAPSADAVSMDEVKEFVRVDTGDTSQDVVLRTLIAGATSIVERYCALAIINQTWEVTYAIGTQFDLPMMHIVAGSVMTVEQRTPSGYAPVAADQFQVVGASVCTKLPMQCRITYVAGFGATHAATPAPLKMAILQHIKTSFELRENVQLGAATSNAPADIRWQRYCQTMRRMSV